jgi:hypothetical protein
MATQEDHTNHELASRLVAAADGIVNQAAADLERDLRDAAELLHEIDRPMVLIPRLVSDLAKIANTTTDVDTQRKLRRLLGEAWQ